jgi:hypothetical protein
MNEKQFKELVKIMKHDLKTVNWAGYDMPETDSAFKLVERYVVAAVKKNVLDTTMKYLDHIQMVLLKTDKPKDQNIIGFVDAVRGYIMPFQGCEIIVVEMPK